MKIISSKSIKHTIQYTWWLYLLVPVLATFLFYWSFNIYHRPTAYEKVSIFVAAEVTDTSFTEDLLKKVDSDSLKEIGVASCDVNAARYEEKLSVVGLNNCDLLILPTSTFELIKNEPLSNYFLPLDSDLQNYAVGDYYEKDSTKFGYKVTNSWLNPTYASFEKDTDYYLVFNTISKNIGEYREKGDTNENALKVAKAILEGI